MIKSVHDYEIETVFAKESNVYYEIPKYQREYTWSIQQWKDIYDDITENDDGYFIGSIICISNSKDTYNPSLEVVDGQQRLTTISLLLAALYNKLLVHKEELEEDNRAEITYLKKSLINEKSPNGLALIPQVQNNNNSDYAFVMHMNGLVKNASKENNWGNRRIAKCYNYFLKRIDEDIREKEDKGGFLINLKKKISKAVIVKIEVQSHSEAYTLFESLNNRGATLTAIDLMKNLILAKAEKVNLDCDDCYEIWKKLLTLLTDDYTIQERFFRQYYNAFKNKLNEPFRKEKGKTKDPLGLIATRSNLLSIFESLIQMNLNEFLDSLRDLSRIQGAPSYLFLMYIIKNKLVLELNDTDINDIIKLLVKFFVRRNITDTPNTRDLIRIFMLIIEEIEFKNIQGKGIFDYTHKFLADKSADDDTFAKCLKGDLYEENAGATRFVLCQLANKYMTHEHWTDLWERNDKKVYKWTIEHIFPEGENIPQGWVDMIANGDKELAKKYLNDYVHKLGNLTITGYNSTLSNMSFEDKLNKKDKEGRYIGYLNGLEVNEYIAKQKKWTIDNIMERTDILVNELLELYKL